MNCHLLPPRACLLLILALPGASPGVITSLAAAAAEPGAAPSSVPPGSASPVTAKLDNAEPKTMPQPGKPWENSLGMRFVPAPNTDVLFCIWETRVKDYAAYAAANRGVDGSWRNREYTRVPVTPQEDCPVIHVSWIDAKSFCDWLTRKDRKAGQLNVRQFYRLPTDVEWSEAVGLGREPGETPKDRDGKVKDVYPWGIQWPPPSTAGNYADESFRDSFGTDWPCITGYRDFHATTAPVGSFPPNRLGIFDLGGNVWEWCEDWYDASQEYRVLRGAAWSGYGRSGLLSSFRSRSAPSSRYAADGFRVVLVVGFSP